MENKMEQVAAMNNFDKLLGKNGELTELIKEQVLAGAMGIIRRHYADKGNKMEAVAALFGKKLGEEFRVIRNYYLSCSYVRARFIDRGFQVHYDGGDYWEYRPEELVDLLTGKAEIVEDEE